MIRCDGFLRSLLFAAVAAAACLPWAILAVPMLGPRPAQAAYLVGVTALYVAAIRPRSAGRLPALSRLGALLLTAAAGAGVAALSRGTAELAIGLAMLLGLARSGFLYRAAPARAVTTEVVLLAGGLCFARFLAGYHPASTMLAVWGFLLVQSLFFLAPAVGPRRAGAPRLDPFDEAHRHAVALLDRSGVAGGAVTRFD